MTVGDEMIPYFPVFAKAPVPRPYGPPLVNTTGAHISLIDSALAKLAFSTAGASGAIAEPAGAWTRYADAARINDVIISDRPSDFVTHGYGADLLMPIARPEQASGRRVAPVLMLGATPDALSRLARPQVQPPVVNVDPLVLYEHARTKAHEAREGALADIRRRLDTLRGTYVQRPPRDVVRELSEDFGVGQLAIARAVGVSPTAVRKWRRGETARGEYRSQLARLAALSTLLEDGGVHDPASWLDIPISTESTLTPLDLFVSRRPDLVVLLAHGLADPQETLDAFDPDWRRSSAPDPEYEVIALADGSRSAVPRSERSAD